nr:MAG TPA: hypothetical protein [Caudoviricetes sp.]
MHNAFELRVWYKSKSDMMYDNNADGILLIGHLLNLLFIHKLVESVLKYRRFLRV